MYLLTARLHGGHGLGAWKRQWATGGYGQKESHVCHEPPPRQRLIVYSLHREYLHRPTSALPSTLRFFSSACLLLVLLSVTMFILVEVYIVFFCVILYSCLYFLPSMCFQHLCPFLLLKKDTKVTDFSLSSIRTCPCKSISLLLSTDRVGSHVFPLVFSNPVPASRVCAPGSPRHVFWGPTPVPMTRVCHHVFLIPLPVVLARSPKSTSLVLASTW